MTPEQIREARIRLAEWMGYQQPFKGAWIEPTTTKDHYLYCGLPDPFTDANDCDALIWFLNDAGWFFQRANEGSNSGKGLILPTITYVRLHRHRPYISHEWRGDDYKQGVCELALKVIDNDT